MYERLAELQARAVDVNRTIERLEALRESVLGELQDVMDTAVRFAEGDLDIMLPLQ